MKCDYAVAGFLWFKWKVIAFQLEVGFIKLQ